MSVLDRFRLDDRVALVTGGGRGLGAEACTALAEVGALVVVSGRNPVALDETVSRIVGSGGRAEPAVLDVTDGDAVDAQVADVVSRHGRLDVLVNNAGIEHQALTTEVAAADWQRVLDVNLNGTFYCAQAFARRATAGGSIVNFASIGAAAGVAGQGAYTASKGAVVALTRSLAAELAPSGLRVNAVAPGYFRTDMPGEVLADPDAEQRLLRRVPQRRIADPDEIGPVIVFLASPASRFMTGATIYFDGGYTAI